MGDFTWTSRCPESADYQGLHEDAVLRAISARVRVAIDKLETGRTAEALAVLIRLDRILPDATAHNMECAEGDERRGRE